MGAFFYCVENAKCKILIFIYRFSKPSGNQATVSLKVVRDRPFNLKGGLWFFVSLRIFFSDNTRVRIIFFLSRKVRIFFPEFNIRLYDKSSESDYICFPPPKSEYLNRCFPTYSKETRSIIITRNTASEHRHLFH
jgi:hypothetical protein